MFRANRAEFRYDSVFIGFVELDAVVESCKYYTFGALFIQMDIPKRAR
jgi:hypothetical protein